MGDRDLCELAAAIAAEQKAAWDDFWAERIDLQALSHRCREVVGEACVRPCEVIARRRPRPRPRRAPGPTQASAGPRTVAALPHPDEVYARRSRQAAETAETS